MVGRPRKDWFTPDTPQCVHVFSRTVRGAFLCGFNHRTGRDCSYRREWIEQRLEFLCQGFAVEALSFATLTNHYHLLLRHRPDWVGEWDDAEVARRAWRIGREGDGEPQPLELRSVLAIPGWVEERRARLSSPSWFMKYLNQYIARRANKEDSVRGHFFQERFGAVLLESEEQLIACSLYVDLNEIRAGIADTLETSLHTSAFRRLARLKKREKWMLEGDVERAIRYEPSDPDYWLAPIDERARVPLLGASIATPIGAEQTDDGELAGDALVVLENRLDRGDLLADITRQVETEFGTAKRDRARSGFLPMSVEQYLELLRRVAALFGPSEGNLERAGWNTSVEGTEGLPGDVGRCPDAAVTPRPEVALKSLVGWLGWIEHKASRMLGSLSDFERAAGLPLGSTISAASAAGHTMPTDYG